MGKRELKKLLWWAAWSSFLEEFEDQLQEIKEVDEEVYKACKVSGNGDNVYAVIEVYKHMLQPVRGDLFGKCDPFHAIELPELVKLVVCVLVLLYRLSVSAKLMFFLD
ncbi:hypothetical protein H5410_056000 [Solanum commersonii]|uniref:Uncharacterized protein n=1 Tax=Solanum commersonii TaxID=4109 RepID=A0A9J5WK03_SOLCO|nr:hypothetical protein H5410_056000 [Solanum commersonii]